MSSRVASFRVAIIGGGIGGLFCALSLHYHCSNLSNGASIDVSVYEQAAQYKEIGAGVGIGVNGARLLHKIGVGEAVNKIAGYRNNVWVSFRRYDNGVEIVTVPVDDKQKIRQVPVHRAEFLDVLLEAIRDRKAATLYTNKQCCEIKEVGDEMVVAFIDGGTAVADLVVGCDGIHSFTRSQYALDKPVYSGQVVYRGLVDIAKLKPWWTLPTYSVNWLGTGKHFLVFPVSQNNTLNIVAFVSVEEKDLGTLKESWTATGKKEEVENYFGDFEETVRKIVAEMPDCLSKWVVNDREPLEQWVHADGKMVLMGDAAHAMLPHQGAGAGQTIEDGYILGRALQDYLNDTNKNTASLIHWTMLYQSVRLPRAQRVQQTSRQAGHLYEMQTAEMNGKSYDECVHIVCDALKDRMKWVWSEDIDEAYNTAKII